MRVDNFEIDYREDGSERQFFSDLSVLDAATGRTLSTQHISVNKPMRWGASFVTLPCMLLHMFGAGRCHRADAANTAHQRQQIPALGREPCTVIFQRPLTVLMPPWGDCVRFSSSASTTLALVDWSLAMLIGQVQATILGSNIKLSAVFHHAGGVTAYQTDWSVSTLVVRVKGSVMSDGSGTPISLAMASLEGRPGGRHFPLTLPSSLR